MAISKHHNLLAFGTETFTGSKLGISSGLNKIEAVVPIQSASLAADATKAVKLTVVIAPDQKTFSIYAWKSTAAGDTTLVAATSAVTVVWQAIGE